MSVDGNMIPLKISKTFITLYLFSTDTWILIGMNLIGSNSSKCLIFHTGMYNLNIMSEQMLKIAIFVIMS